MASFSVPVRRMLAGNALSALGTGFVLPLTLIYLHSARHIPLTTTGLLLAIPGVVGLAAVPAAGVFMDRLGSRRVLLGLLLLMAVSQVELAAAAGPAAAAVALVLTGVARGATFPAYNVLLVQLTPDSRDQQRAFGVSFTLINAGIGLGALVGALVVDVRHPGTFQVLFLGNAVSFLLEAALIASVRVPAGVDRQPGARRGGYREVVADPMLRRVLLLSLLLALTGYAALDAGLPAYANVAARVPARVVALALAANTALIVLAQLFVLRLLRGRRRTRALAVVGVVWSVSWVLLGTSVVPGSLLGRSIIVLAFSALFGLGETFMAPTAAPLSNTLTPDHIRGRANALYSGMFSIAAVVAPPLAAGFIAAGAGAVWIALEAVGALGITVLALRLGRVLTPAQDVGQAALPPEPVVEIVARTE